MLAMTFILTASFSLIFSLKQKAMFASGKYQQQDCDEVSEMYGDKLT